MFCRPTILRFINCITENIQVTECPRRPGRATRWPALNQSFGTCYKSTTYGDGTECSETSAYKIQTPRNHTKERIQHSEHGESLKSGTLYLFGAFRRVYVYT